MADDIFISAVGRPVVILALGYFPKEVVASTGFHQSPRCFRSSNAAALQISMRDPRVPSTICGICKPERIAQTLERAHHPDSMVGTFRAALRDPDPEATRDDKPG